MGAGNAIAGKTGTLTLASGSENEIISWEVSITADMLDATSFDSEGWRQFVVGLKGATGSCTSWDDLSAASGALVLSNSNVSSVSISGEVLFSEEGISNEVDGLMQHTNAFTFTGAVSGSILS